jgi:RHS repeat-associated protein
MLAFITPRQSLLPGTGYLLSTDGPTDAGNRKLPPATITFTTEGESVVGGGVDDEVWVPNGRNWKSGRARSQWEDLPLLEAPPGVTALAGRVLKLNGKPLENVTLELHGGYKTVTDETGRFLLANIPAGHHSLWVNGHTANKPGKTYGIFAPGVDIQEGVTNVLAYTIWMPRIDTAHAATIPSPTPRDIVITTPRLKGLELHLPAGTVIRDHHGKTITEVSITPIPLDRPPFPLPAGVEVPIYFTIQPGGAYIHVYGAGEKKGARLIYPNPGKEPPGTIFDFWNYDPYGKGWYVYGNGRVSENGRSVIPDPGVEIYEFTGAMVGNTGTTPEKGPPQGDECNTDGDPVDCSTGLFIHTMTDLFLPDVLPIALARTYRNEDSRSRPFGIGATHNFEIYNIGDTIPWTFQELILPDGGRIRYEEINGGASHWTEAVYEHTATPTKFYGSRISWNGNGWDLKLKDGTVYVFPESAGITNNPSKAAILRIRDRYGNHIILTRDSASGNLTKITSPNGRWIELTYDASNRITLARDNIGREVSYEYDASGRLWKVTNPAGGVTEYTYDASHRMLTVKNPRGITQVTNEYDAEGRVIKQTLANQKTYLFSYTTDAGGQITQTDVTDPRGNVRRITFSPNGYTLSNTYALGTAEEQTTTFERDPDTNLLLRVTDPLGRKTAYSYDAMGNITSITRLAETPDAVTTTFTHEPTFNRLETITDPLNHTTTFAYGSSGNLTTITDPLNSQTSFNYNAAGQQTSATDPLNSTTQFSYSFGDLDTVTDPLGRTTTRFTDSAGRLLSVTNPLGQAARYEYDDLNRLERVIDPHGGETLFIYDPNGNLLSITDARSNTTSYSYDDMDRLETRTDPLLNVASSQYDEMGNLTQLTDRRGKVTQFSYDPLDRRTFAGFGWNGANYESTVTYTYDAGNRLTQLVDSQAGTIPRSYDGLDRLVSESMPQGTVSYTYDEAGRRTSMTVAGQPVVNYSYDDADRMTQITQGTSTVSFGYDAAGRRATLTLPNGIVIDYSYDAAYQLTALTYTKGPTVLGNLTYGYDDAGRRSGVGGTFARTGLPQPVASASYNAANQLTQWSTSTLTYDANGNLTNDGVTSSTWDARNRLVSVSGGSTASFQYDALDRRISKTIDGATTEFVYDGVNPVQEKDGATVIANLLTGLGVDEHFTRTDVAWQQNFLPDGLGSTLALADASGTVATEYTYEPFGKSTVTGAATTNSFQYTGRENDSTGLYYYRARYYNPALQRFISEDPIQLRGGINFYSYVYNDPVNLVDPEGRQGLWPALAAAGAAAAIDGPLPIGDLVGLGILATAAYYAVPKDVPFPDVIDDAVPRDVPRCRDAEDEERDRECWDQYWRDIAVCRRVRTRRCYASAMERLVACRSNRYIPPLITW